MGDYNDMQLVKRRFFAMRNGIIADTMRKAGSTYRIVFGLNLPQIKEIAAELGHNSDLAWRLWADTGCRESTLLAPYLLNVSDVPNAADVVSMLSSAQSCESIDIAVLALLRRHGALSAVIDELVKAESELLKYASMRLALSSGDLELMSSLDSLSKSVLSAPECYAPSLRQVAHQIQMELTDDWDA